MDLRGNSKPPYSEHAKSRTKRLGGPPSSNRAVPQASTYFDEVAAPCMQQMYSVQKDAVKGHDQELEWKVQQLTDGLCQVSRVHVDLSESLSSNILCQHTPSSSADT